ncbi:hydroxyacylglutathione hydrolase [Herbaspirillum sp.]|uniref:hydroxyacylglutathione hydrolase n=1 Tax=Herbaspirillum sp. TaxID=1890675 RepID=UPI0031CFDFDD
MDVLAVPAFDDNYLWIIHDGRYAAVVDPGDATPVLAALQAEGLTLAAILLTHHHADHVGGVVELARQAVSDDFPVVPVYGPAREQSRIKGITVPLHGNEQVNIAALGLQLEVIEVPGHTLGHIAYYTAQQQMLFCGDTLFAGGCGRLFEGSPQQMVESLGKLAGLPASTQVYCAHEYTLSNLKFAVEVEPGNAELIERISRERARREQGLPTLPTSIALERQTNPFLRASEKEILQSLQKTGRLTQLDEVSSFAALREWKNTYR